MHKSQVPLAALFVYRMSRSCLGISSAVPLPSSPFYASRQAEVPSSAIRGAYGKAARRGRDEKVR